MKHAQLKVAITSSVILVSVIAVSFVVFYPSATAPSTPTHTTRRITGTPVHTNQITIQDYTFTPRIISVKKGTTVMWTNNDTVTHSVVFDNHRYAKSGPLNGDASFSLVFDTIGEYTYHGGIYPDAVGKIVVTD